MSVVKNIQKFFEQLISNRKKVKLQTETIANPSIAVSPAFKSNPIPEISFESDMITPITSSEILDTTDPLNVAKYKNNLKLLVAQARQEGKISKFVTIRNDDFFPNDMEWQVGCRDTAMELTGSTLTYALRKRIAMQNTGMPTGLDYEKGIFYDLLIPEEKVTEQMALLDKDLGKICQPVHFRSTKHYTVNTPLSYTGEYNYVDSDRTFTVIDSMDNFLNSGYGYSASYRDAYLDVTHESLPISENAIILIAEDKYQSVIQDPILANTLANRRVVVYRGESAVAINMILTEQGILPARPGNRYMVYDSDIHDILEGSMQQLCEEHDLAYNQGHGNIDGRGGHFTDNYDSLNHEHESYIDDFINFLRMKIPDCKDVLSPIILRDSAAADKAIQVIGAERLVALIEEYNTEAMINFSSRYQSFKNKRMAITPEISHIFKATVKAIDNYYKENKGIFLPEEETRLVQLFFHSRDVEEQLLAATTLCQKWGISLVPNLQESDLMAKK